MKNNCESHGRCRGIIIELLMIDNYWKPWKVERKLSLIIIVEELEWYCSDHWVILAWWLDWSAWQQDWSAWQHDGEERDCFMWWWGQYNFVLKRLVCSWYSCRTSSSYPLKRTDEWNSLLNGIMRIVEREHFTMARL